MKTRKSWREKLDRPAEITAIPPMWEKRMGKGRLLIPAPADLEALIRKTPKGRVTAQGALRTELARAAGVEATCPLTTGIFVRMIAEANEEERAAGKSRITPWWRVVKDDGKLLEKGPGAPQLQAARLREEGVEVREIRGKPRVMLP